MFRIINLHNKNTQLSSLKGLREIYKLVGLNKISRLTNSKESLEVAIEMFKVILSNINQPIDDDSQQPQNGNGDGSSSDEQGSDDGNGGSSQGMSDDDFNDLLKELGESPIGGDKDETPTGGNSMDVGNLPDNMEGKPSEDNSPSTNSVQLSDRQKDLLKKKIEKQKKFMDGDIQKTSLTKTDSKNLNAIEESGSEMKEVGKDVNNGYYGNQSVQCIVVKKMTKGLFESEMFPMTRTDYWVMVSVDNGLCRRGSERNQTWYYVR